MSCACVPPASFLLSNRHHHFFSHPLLFEQLARTVQPQSTPVADQRRRGGASIEEDELNVTTASREVCQFVVQATYCSEEQPEFSTAPIFQPSTSTTGFPTLSLNNPRRLLGIRRHHCWCTLQLHFRLANSVLEVSSPSLLVACCEPHFHPLGCRETLFCSPGCGNVQGTGLMFPDRQDFNNQRSFEI